MGVLAKMERNVGGSDPFSSVNSPTLINNGQNLQSIEKSSRNDEIRA